jgi:hypothetical protein
MKAWTRWLSFAALAVAVHAGGCGKATNPIHDAARQQLAAQPGEIRVITQLRRDHEAPIIRRVAEAAARVRDWTGMPPREPVTVRVFRDREAWATWTAANVAEPETLLTIRRGGYARGTVAALHDIGNLPTQRLAAHEATHALFAATLQSPLPPFVEEGLARHVEWQGQPMPPNAPTTNLPLATLLRTSAADVAGRPALAAAWYNDAHRLADVLLGEHPAATTQALHAMAASPVPFAEALAAGGVELHDLTVVR